MHLRLLQGDIMKIFVSVTAGGVILNKKKQICLVNDKSIRISSWSLPKGRIKKGESLIETARREIYEETGLKDLSLIEKLGVIRRPSNVFSLIEKEIHIFLFKSVETKLNPLPGNILGNTSAQWFSFDDAISRITSNKDKEFLRSKRNEIFKKII